MARSKSIPEVHMTISSVPIVGKTRKLNWKWRQEGVSTALMDDMLNDEESEPISEDDLDKLAQLNG